MAFLHFHLLAEAEKKRIADEVAAKGEASDMPAEAKQEVAPTDSDAK